MASSFSDKKKIALLLMVLGVILLHITIFAPFSLKTDEKHKGLSTYSGQAHRPQAQKLPPSPSRHSSCTPVHHFVFPKTRKTGGSTVASILLRYGIANNLTVVLPRHEPVFDLQALDFIQYNCSSFKGYNYLAHHMHYNRSVLDTLIPNAKYFTILRSPYTQFQSAFYFYGFSKRLISTDMSDAFFKLFKEYSSGRISLLNLSRLKNSQIWILGLDHEYHDNQTAVDLKIRELDEELDLVMLLEYFDESLVLLRKTMCWDFSDVAYGMNKVHKAPQEPFPASVKSHIERWNSADFKLYDHFNRTFWERVKNYDGDFEEDLRLFRMQQSAISAKCDAEEPKSQFCSSLRQDTNGLRGRARREQDARLC